MKNSPELEIIYATWDQPEVDVGKILTQTFSLSVDSSQIAVLTPKQNLQFLGNLENIRLEVEEDLYRWTLDWRVVDQTQPEMLIHKVEVFHLEGDLLRVFKVKSKVDEFPMVKPITFNDSWEQELSQLAPEREVNEPWEVLGLVILFPLVWIAHKLRKKYRIKKDWIDQQNLTLLKTRLNASKRNLTSSQAHHASNSNDPNDSNESGDSSMHKDARVELFKLSEAVLREIYSPGQTGVSWKNLSQVMTNQEIHESMNLDSFLGVNLKQKHKTTSLREFHQIVISSLGMLSIWHSLVYAPKADTSSVIDETELDAILKWVNLLEVKDA